MQLAAVVAMQTPLFCPSLFGSWLARRAPVAKPERPPLEWL